ncbi:hypothetical protein EKO04_002456 [Ascochyta lentis]|uniref:Cytochrome P450 n=1 Tax=Ascochyta lentis TaxID=205686 RepID=A0A8H7JAW3_9PLEO|nr:hypothetical protein EKO04_002456 [Ascochyta lentis]
MVGSMLDVVSTELGHAQSGDLYSWIRHTICLASTDALYGPCNPFRVDPELEDAFWDYDADLSLLLLNVFPSITARKGYRARKALKRAFTNYFRSGGANEASDFVRACNEANTKRGASEEDRAGFEVAHCIGLLVNTPPTLFWTLFHIYSNPMLLEQLRAEISGALMVGSRDEHAPRILDSGKITNNCPLLHSTFKEVLRVHASSLSTRIVLEDTSIGNDILLKKGSLVHMPSKCLHSDEKHFGPNADMFDPARFLGDTLSKPQIAFRPFGGGSTLCPGRQFATMQILSITALVLLSYDLVPEDGKWNFPESLQSTMTTTVLPPIDNIHVRFQSREDVDGYARSLKA